MPPVLEKKTVIGKRCCSSLCHEGEMILSRLFLGFASIALSSTVCFAQEEKKINPPAAPPTIVEAAAKNLAHSIVSRKADFDSSHSGPDPRDLFGISTDKLAIFALASALAPDRAQAIDYVPKYIAALETARTDKQVSASAKAPGSTSIVDKPGIPSLLAMAIDSGAVAKNVSGSTLNLSTSPYALLASMQGDTAATYQQFSGFTRIGISAAFNIQNQQDPLASVQRKNLSEIGVK